MVLGEFVVEETELSCPLEAECAVIRLAVSETAQCLAKQFS